MLSYMGYVGRVLLYMMYLSVAFNLHGVGPAVEGFCSSRRWASSRGGDKNKPPGKPRVAATSPGHMHVGGWWAWVDAVAALRFERAVGAFSGHQRCSQTPRCSSMVSICLARLTTTASMPSRFCSVGQTALASVFTEFGASNVPVGEMREGCILGV